MKNERHAILCVITAADPSFPPSVERCGPEKNIWTSLHQIAVKFHVISIFSLRNDPLVNLLTILPDKTLLKIVHELCGFQSNPPNPL